MFHTPHWSVIKYQTCAGVIKHPKHLIGVTVHLQVSGYTRVSLKFKWGVHTHTSFLTVQLYLARIEGQYEHIFIDSHFYPRAQASG